jgi:hypothetical protein
MALRPIIPVEDITVQAATPANDRGPAPQLQWLKIADLVVDETYQRPIGRAGRANVKAIAEGFRWQSFSPVIVSPIDGGRFAIVDGQHRATAAALCGIETVPCQVILATPDGQAAAFAQINGRTTSVHSMSLFRAAVAAGDPAALVTQSAADRAGVTILPYPKPVAEQKPGETMAHGAIGLAVREHGVDLTALALKAMRGPNNDHRGVLVAPLIRAVCSVVAQLAKAGKTAAEIHAAIDRLRLARELDSTMVAAREKGRPLIPLLAERLLHHATRTLEGGGVAPPLAVPPKPAAVVQAARPVVPSAHAEAVERAKAAVPSRIDSLR